MDSIHISYILVIILLIVIITVLGAKLKSVSDSKERISKITKVSGDERVSSLRSQPLTLVNYSDDNISPLSFTERADIVKEYIEIANAEIPVHIATLTLRDDPHSHVGVYGAIAMELCRKQNEKRFKSTTNPNHYPIKLAEAAVALEYLRTTLDIRNLGVWGPKSHDRFDACIILLSESMKCFSRQIDWVKDNCPWFYHADVVTSAFPSILGETIRTMAYLDSTPGIKTKLQYSAALAGLAFVTGWTFGGGELKNANEFDKAGQYFGIAMMISKDIAEYETTKRADRQPEDDNFVSVFGSSMAYKELEKNINNAKIILFQHKLHTTFWKEVFELLVPTPLEMSATSSPETQDSDHHDQTPSETRKAPSSDIEITDE